MTKYIMNPEEFALTTAIAESNEHLFTDRAPETYREYAPTKEQTKVLVQNGFSEIDYIDYSESGVIRRSSEDFSYERFRSLHVCRGVYIPTGKLDKGGHKRWELAYKVISSSVKACGKIARIKEDGKEISIRMEAWVH